MTYRRFIALARRVRSEAAPDPLDTEPAAEQSRPRSIAVLPIRRTGWAVAATAVAACVAVTAGVLFSRASGAPETPPPLDGPTVTAPDSPTSPTDTDIPSLTVQAPLWYAPGSVAVQEEVFKEQEDNGGRIAQAGVLDVSWQAGHLPGHEECGGIYYFAATDETVCCEHIARAALEAEGLWKSGSSVWVADFQPTRRILLLVHRVGDTRRTYVYNDVEKTLKQVTGPVYSLGGTAGMHLWRDADRTYSLMLNTDAEGNETLMLIDLLTGETITVAPWAHKVAEDGFFSPTGKYVVFTKGVSDTSSVERDTVVYTVADGTVREIQGLVRHILPDDSGLVVETPAGLVLFDGTTGESTPFADADLPEWYRYHVRKGKQYANDCHELVIADMVTGTETVLPQEVHAWQVDGNGRYLYYYLRGAAGVTCRDIATGQEFSVAVSDAFVTMQERYADREIQFYLLLDEEAKTLHLSYIRYDRPRQDSEAIKEARRGNVRIRYSERMQEGVTCLADFSELIGDFPEGLTLCYGEGYTYLDCSSWMDENAYWVEDYRIGQMYYVASNGEVKNLFMHVTGVQALPEDAKQRTDAMQKRYGLPVGEATVDYGRFVTKDGEVDRDAQFAVNTAAEKLMSVTNGYIVEGNPALFPELNGPRYYQQTEEDLQQLCGFLEFVNTLTFVHTEDYWDYEDGYEVIVKPFCGYDLVKEIRFGRYGGKPVVVIGSRYAHCTEAEYTRWMTWAADKARECQIPVEEIDFSDQEPEEPVETHPSGVYG